MSQTPDHDQHDQVDEQLLAQLRGADPAGPLPPLPEDALDELLRATTSAPRASAGGAGSGTTPAHTTTTTSGTTEAATPHSAVASSLAGARRRRHRWTGAAALGLAAAAAGVVALSAGVPGLPGGAGGDPAVTALRVAAPSGAIAGAVCAPIDAAALAGDDLAFRGTVTEVRSAEGGEVVVLDVARVFRGDLGRRVEVSTPGAGSSVDGTVQLVPGQDYLVAAFDGTVSGCGATGAVTPELSALYEQAFGGGS